MRIPLSQKPGGLFGSVPLSLQPYPASLSVQLAAIGEAVQRPADGSTREQVRRAHRPVSDRGTVLVTGAMDRQGMTAARHSTSALL
jgi:hypothetical protein